VRRPVSSSALSEQDEDAAEVNEAQIVERMMLIAYHQSAKVPQPGEEPFDLPTALVPTQ
jgi:hypothetical protein